MGRPAIDLTGKRFGRLVVLERVKSDRKDKPAWRCLCDCGEEIVSYSDYLSNGHTRSCGCLSREKVRERSTTHGCSGTRLYGIWRGMIQRCECVSDARYKDYGARGIFVCRDWHDFQAFRDWSVVNGYSDELSIDRIDNNGPYSPDNCRWTNCVVQSNNRRKNRIINYNGESHTLAEWCRKFSLKYKTVSRRLETGHSLEDAFSEVRLHG